MKVNNLSYGVQMSTNGYKTKLNRNGMKVKKHSFKSQKLWHEDE